VTSSWFFLSTPTGKFTALKHFKRNPDSAVGSEQTGSWTIQVILAEAAGISLNRNVPTKSVARPVPRVIFVRSMADGA
jgi:hypothetical protein